MADKEEKKPVAHEPAGPPTIEEHAKKLGTPPYALAGAKILNKWGVGSRMTEEAFKAGIEKWGTLPLGPVTPSDAAKEAAKAAEESKR